MNAPNFPPPVEFGGVVYRPEMWIGQPIPDSPLAFDTETELIRRDDPEHIPKLALVTAYTGNGACWFIHPDRLAEFVLACRDHHLVGHHVAFDFVVVANHLGSWARRWDALDVWWSIADRGHLHCTQILDRLVELARTDEHPASYRTLEALAKEYLGFGPDKSDPYRLRYAELVYVPAEGWSSLESGFFTYAIKDSIATLLVWDKLYNCARKFKPYLDKMLPYAEEKFGILTETLQVRGAIALGVIDRAGIGVDLDQVARVRIDLQEVIEAEGRRMQTLADPYTNHGIFKINRHGKQLKTAAEVVRRNSKVIKEVLDKIAKEYKLEAPVNDDGLVTDAVAFWKQHAEVHPFIEAYTTWAAKGKLAQFLVNLKTKRIYPHYTPLVRTGRTSCSNPNLQQLPRKGEFREMIVPAEGYWLAAIDYSTLELRTLAQTCLINHKYSKLADVLIAGGDPHVHTAMMMMNLTEEEFKVLPKGKQRDARQRAKAVNFGVPGGLGAKTLMEYAKAGYGVDFSFDEARELRKRLIYEIYSELAKHLREDRYQIVARNLMCNLEVVYGVFPERGQLDEALNVIAECNPSSFEHFADIWDKIAVLNQNPELAPLLAKRKPNHKLASRIFHGDATIVSGRIRGHIRFTARCNAPFQGLAADGAKLAMFKLAQAGYRLVGFVHDEVLIEIPKSWDLDDAYARISKILCSTMQELTPDIPIQVEGLIADCWAKVDQEFDTDGRIVPYEHPERPPLPEIEEKVVDKQLRLW